MQIQDITGAVSTRLGIDPSLTERLVGTVLSVISHEADPAKVSALMGSIAGASDLATRYDVMAHGGGGLLGMLGGAIGGKAGALVNGITQISDTGLDMSQIRDASSTLFSHAEAAVGPDVVQEVLGSIPGLKGHLGL